MQDLHHRVQQILYDLRTIGIIKEELFVFSFAPFFELQPIEANLIYEMGRLWEIYRKFMFAVKTQLWKRVSIFGQIGIYFLLVFDDAWVAI